MQVAVVTLFPELISDFVQAGMVGRALASGELALHVEPLRRHGLGVHQSVDDTPYGGGSGMVLRVDCVISGIEAAERALGSATRPTRVLLTPQGARLTQALVRELSGLPALLLVCGRYEGFDERVRSFVDRELSLGDFVLTGGELAALSIIEACVRLLPGVLGNSASAREESFSEPLGGGLEYPQYTRPVSYRGLQVPEVLLSGHHEQIRRFREQASLSRTRERRPDLVAPAHDGPNDPKAS